MAKSNRSKHRGSDEMQLEARVDLTEEKIRRYLLDERLREAAAMVAAELKLVRRIKDGVSLSGAWIEGDGPVYTTVQVRRYSLEALCTCPMSGPCPHGGALALVYMADPASFLDLDKWLDDLDGRPRDELLDMLRMVLSSIPAALEMVDIPGFDGVLTAEPPVDDDWWDDDDWEDLEEEYGALIPEDPDGVYLDDEDDEDLPDPENMN